MKITKEKIMQCLIKEWPNKMATLMTEDGVVLWTFSNVEEARKVWQDWCSLHGKHSPIPMHDLNESV
jgi:hypothetical protein